MEENYRILQEYFSDYCYSSLNVEVETDYSSVSTIRGNTYDVVTGKSLKMTTQFCSVDGFESFMNDISGIVEEHKNRRLRKIYPALQHAYEEYQILLKLYK